MNKNSTQKGNVLFLILIAVALFAALSYAVTQSTRGGGDTGSEKQALVASQILQFFSDVNVAVIRMRIRGVDTSLITFDPLDTTVNGVFSPSGGGVSYLNVPNNIGNATDWGFGSLQSANLGIYIQDVGANTDVSGREAIGGLADISLGLCEALNKQLGLTNPPEPNSPTSGAVATYSINANVLDAYPGAPFACVHTDDGTGVYLYYHATIEQ